MRMNAFKRSALAAVAFTMGVTGCGAPEEAGLPEAPPSEAEVVATTEAALAPPFSCGPHAFTYYLLDSNNMVSAIRCVKVVNDHSFAWYGEGRLYNGTYTYRHVGYAASDNFNGGVRFWGSMADIHGNGETGRAFFNQNLAITTPQPISQNPVYINVTGGVTEVWHRAPSNTTHYAQLPYDLLTCGNPALNQMRVQGWTTDHVRCLLDLKDGVNLPYAWVGKGKHGGSPYFHLGTGNFQLGGGWGASDLCFTSSHYCGSVPFGNLSLSLQPFGNIYVSGAWNEVWYPF